MKMSEKFEKYPEYESYTQLIDQLDPNSHPQITVVHSTFEPICGSDKKLGIFSGSFNPLTVAHIKMVDEARAQFQLDEVLLLLAKANVDKDVFGWSLAERLLTLKRYAEKRKDMSVGVSSHGRYIDKVDALEPVYPAGTAFHFIVGYDTLVRIFDAKYYTDLDVELSQLFARCSFIVANRDDVDIRMIRKELSHPKLQPYNSGVHCLLLPEFYSDVSSTEVRHRILIGEPISHLVPPIIAEFLT